MLEGVLGGSGEHPPRGRDRPCVPRREDLPQDACKRRANIWVIAGGPSALTAGAEERRPLGLDDADDRPGATPAFRARLGNAQ